MNFIIIMANEKVNLTKTSKTEVLKIRLGNDAKANK